MANKMTPKQLLAAKLITNQQFIVLSELRKSNKPVSNRRLSIITGLAINIITPRVYALRKKVLVISGGREYDRETNRTVSVWAAI